MYIINYTRKTKSMDKGPNLKRRTENLRAPILEQHMTSLG